MSAESRPVHEGPNLLDLLEDGRRARDAALTVASASTHTGWRLVAERSIAELAATGEPWTADDLRERTGDPVGSHPNAMGGAINAAVRRGIIEPVGYDQARRPEAHARVLRVWRGVGHA